MWIRSWCWSSICGIWWAVTDYCNPGLTDSTESDFALFRSRFLVAITLSGWNVGRVRPQMIIRSAGYYVYRCCCSHTITAQERTNYNSPCDRTSQEFNDFGKLFLKQTFLDQNRILSFYRIILILNRTRSTLQNHGFITTH